MPEDTRRASGGVEEPATTCYTRLQRGVRRREARVEGVGGGCEEEEGGAVAPQEELRERVEEGLGEMFDSGMDVVLVFICLENGDAYSEGNG